MEKSREKEESWRERVEVRFDKIEDRLGRLEDGQQRLEERFDGLEERFEGRFAALDDHFDFLRQSMDRHHVETRRYFEMILEENRSERAAQGEGIAINRDRIQDHEVRIGKLEAS